ncbi:MAG TPA: endo-1,4-beta-xylanase [Nostocaceae cyanobacterium]|nr:endo-1,4-beta-xylanase [Nostocaceae cyanobacterium]
MFFSTGLGVNHLSDQALTERVDKYFNVLFILTKNPLIAPYKYDFSELNQLEAWGRKHKKTMRMGAILCPWFIPNWLKSASYSSAQLWGILKDYIYHSIYGRDFYSYDFLVETFNFHGQVNDYWSQHLGKNYLISCLNYAAEIKGNQRLLYSDCSYKSDEKWSGVLQFLRDIKSEGLIDGVSLQVQINIIPGLDDTKLVRRINQIQDLGYPVELPEVTVWRNPYTPIIIAERSQGYFYGRVLDIAYIMGINLFGILSPFDKYPWLYDEELNRSPGIFDQHFRPKSFFSDLLLHNYFQQVQIQATIF